MPKVRIFAEACSMTLWTPLAVASIGGIGNYIDIMRKQQWGEQGPDTVTSLYTLWPRPTNIIDQELLLDLPLDYETSYSVTVLITALYTLSQYHSSFMVNVRRGL